MALKLDMWHRILEKYNGCSNSGLGLTMTILRQDQEWENARNIKGLGSIRGYFGLNIFGKLNTFV